MSMAVVERLRKDPVKLAAFLWPEYHFYDKQRDGMVSVWENRETIVSAGHKLGKDFKTGAIELMFFLTRTPCRVVNTSVDAAQLEGVLWGEMRRFIQDASIPLTADKGGPLIVNHMHLRKLKEGRRGKEVCGLSYMIGRVAAKGEGLSGHHLAQDDPSWPLCLGVVDEASGVDQESLDKMDEWLHRLLVIGNPYECNNYFKWAVNGKPGSLDRGGDMPNDGNPAYKMRRKVIRIQGMDSPNVRYALAEIEQGKKPSGRVIIPGVLTWSEFNYRNKYWDRVKRTVGVEARFYEGSENLLFPPAWLDRANMIHDNLSLKSRSAEAMGVDPGEGRDKTAWVIIDRYGVIAVYKESTPNTSRVRRRTRELMREYDIPEDRVMFDRGNGGQVHVDALADEGINVRSVAFGEGVTQELRQGVVPFEFRKAIREDRTVYLNRRAQMYHRLRLLLDPHRNPQGFGLPREELGLRDELAPIPLLYNPKEQMYLPPKNRRDGSKGVGGMKTLVELIGHSPDEADALVCAVHGLLTDEPYSVAGAV